RPSGNLQSWQNVSVGRSSGPPSARPAPSGKSRSDLAGMNGVASTSFQPANASEVVEAVRAAPRVIPVGAQTKPRLSKTESVSISTLSLRGIVEYEPSEFTFTALSGTPIREIAVALAERGQYLPFDPVLVRAGSTLGGTIACGLSGPGRF